MNMTKEGSKQADLDRRILSRIPVNREIIVGINDRELKPGRLLNLSLSGALLMTTLKLSVNQIIEIRLATNTPPFCKAAVVRLATADTYGIKWLEFNEDHLPKGFLFNDRM